MILPIDQRGSAASLSSWIYPTTAAAAVAASVGGKWNYHRRQQQQQCYYFCPLKTFYCKEIIKIRSGGSCPSDWSADRLCV